MAVFQKHCCQSLLICAGVYIGLGSVASAAEEARPPGSMLFLDNDVIRVGVDRSLGGAITWISLSGSDRNIVNSYDFGRQIQMSYYAGPVPYSVGDKRPSNHWQHLGWNPIQSGDDFGNRTEVLNATHDGKTIHSTCRPRQWPLNDVRANCRFDVSLSLDGPAVLVRCRLTNSRKDTQQYRARDQEMPAVYTNGEFFRVMTYTGNAPFTNGALTRIPKKTGPGFPWTKWSATENWSAIVDRSGFGLGIWQPYCTRFIGGFAGREGQGTSKDNASGYMAPTRREIIDHNIVHEYQYRLIVGSLRSIRDYVYAIDRPSHSAFDFTNDRQGWFYVNAKDSGWPIRDALQIQLEQNDPQIISPEFFWPAQESCAVTIRAGIKSEESSALLFWATPTERGFSEQRSIRFPITPDGSVRDYVVTLPQKTRAITQLRIDPVSAGRPGQSLRLLSVHGSR